MKKICLAALWLLASGAAHAEGGLLQRIGDASRTTFYETLCKHKPEAPACYMTPMGKPVWHLQEPQRGQWLRIAQDLQGRASGEAPPQPGTAGDWEALREQEAAMFCDFWRQQEDSPRTREQLSRYCR